MAQNLWFMVYGSWFMVNDQWFKIMILILVQRTGGRVLSLRVWRCNPVSRIIGVSNNQ